MSNFLSILEKFKLRLSEKQSTMTQKIFQVSYTDDQNVISIQYLLDIESQLA